MIPLIEGIAEVRGRYDALIVDLWGVVHNGMVPYPGVVDALQRLRADGKRVCLLSNAPRRVATVAARLDEIGVPRDAWDHLLTSGEATRIALLERADPFHAALGRRFFHLGPPRDDDVHAGLDYERVWAVEAADFVLNSGIDRAEETVAFHGPTLEAAAARKLPMVCANPDLIVRIGDHMQICAGALAARYVELGGAVAWHGKPHRSVYERCFGLLGQPERARVLAIGDAFHTDMAGAAGAGIDGLFVLGGIHSDEVGLDRPDMAVVERLAEEHGARPAAAIRRLVW